MPPGKDRDAAATPNWSNPVFSLTTSAAVHATLNDESLLDTFFERLHQICTLIEAQAHSANTELARDMIDKRRVQILFYGRSGAGKTTLIGTLTDQKEKLHAFSWAKDKMLCNWLNLAVWGRQTGGAIFSHGNGL